jgi:hypothetical protein
MVLQIAEELIVCRARDHAFAHVSAELPGFVVAARAAYAHAMSSASDAPVVLAGVNCTITLSLLAEHAVLIQIAGTDVGELDRRPFVVLDELLQSADPVELFIDAREALGPSIDVSAQWAAFLRERRARFSHVNMLTRSRFVQLTADFVQRFAELGDRMRILTDPTSFDTAVQLASRR